MKNNNHYEELIDQMMIDEVSGLDISIKATLEGLTDRQKRMAILSILDKDRDLYVKIRKLVVDNNVSKVEHIRGVVEMLRKYVEVGEREQKEFGEVFTKYSTISDMLDLVSVEDWSNPNMKFLDTSAGAGNFPAVIIERLMDGLINTFPNEEDRYKHIVENMIYMVELQAKNAFLILAALDPLDIYELNILNASFLSEEFDNHMKNVWCVDNFDYVVQNPPYQKMDGGHASSSLPLYNEFIIKSIDISNKLISIHPSRWMSGGKGLKKFRNMMLSRKDIKVIIHYANPKEIFGNSVDIEGGIQYFLIDKSYMGLTKYNNVLTPLDIYDIFIESKYHNIIEKLNKYDSLQRICRPRSTYPLQTNDNRLTDIKIDNNILCYVSKQKGFIKFVDVKYITRNIDTISEFKVITARANGKKKKFGNKFIGKPNQICTDSYISFKCNDENSAINLISYMDTLFCNFLLGLRKNTQDIKPDTCKWIPLVPLDREWTDEQLFEYFDLTLEERNLILNSNV